MHIAYYPIMPNTDFTVTAQFADGGRGNISLSSTPQLSILNGATQEIVNNTASWKLNGDAGNYKLTVDYNTEEYSHDLLITTDRTYDTPQQIIPDSKLKTLTVDNKAVHPFGESFNLFGWYPGWLATYIILSLILSASFRKLFDVY